MRILIITQKIDKNDDILGFFHGWVEEFAKHCESVVVICLQKGEYNFSKNVKVLSLGKEKFIRNSHNWHKIRILASYILNFYKYIWQERENYESVFVHMNQEYVILGGLFWKLWRKKTALWYTHKQVDLKLRLAEKLVDKVFTASKESFRLPSKKVEITGHGIDIENLKFQIPNPKSPNSKFKIISVGRISKIKNLDILVEAGEILKNKGFSFTIKIAGSPLLEEDRVYFEKIKQIIEKKEIDDIIKFIGPISHKNISEFYADGDLFVNFSDTGSMDKAVLEAMSCGLEILTSNEAFSDVVPEKNFTTKDPKEIAGKIIILSKSAPDASLMDYVIQNHNLNNLIDKISNFYE